MIGRLVMLVWSSVTLWWNELRSFVLKSKEFDLEVPLYRFLCAHCVTRHEFQYSHASICLSRKKVASQYALKPETLKDADC